MIKVLLVDDQELFRAGIQIIIDAQPDMTVVGSARDGREAVELARSSQPDIVLMDMRMPEMDGVEATKVICAGHDAPRVIVLTTFNLDERAAEAIRGGASGFLLKDTGPTQLCDAIRTVHAGNAVLAPKDLNSLLDGRFREPTPPPASFGTLTEKEREVFRAVAQGLSNIEIGRVLFASESTIKTHVGSVLRKLQLRDRVQIVVYAHQYSLV
jgi:DNA-binding NarL/FixJ family response regulator